MPQTSSFLLVFILQLFDLFRLYQRSVQTSNLKVLGLIPLSVRSFHVVMLST